MSQSQISEADETVDQAMCDNQSAAVSQMATNCQVTSNVSGISHSDRLSHDWGKILREAKAFGIPDPDRYPDSLANQTESDDLVPEPPSLSGIIDSTIPNSSSKPTSVEENYIDDYMSSSSNSSYDKVSDGPKKHEYGKERFKRKGNIYDKLYNACLKGELRVINHILKKCTETLAPDEEGRTPLYAACIGDHLEVVKLLMDSGYEVNHQDNDGKTPLHVVFENHAPDLAKSLITQFYANTDIRDTLNWTPLHTAIDRGYYNYSQQLSQFLHQDAGTEIS